MIKRDATLFITDILRDREYQQHFSSTPAAHLLLCRVHRFWPSQCREQVATRY